MSLVANFDISDKSNVALYVEIDPKIWITCAGIKEG